MLFGASTCYSGADGTAASLERSAHAQVAGVAGCKPQAVCEAVAVDSSCVYVSLSQQLGSWLTTRGDKKGDAESGQF